MILSAQIFCTAFITLILSVSAGAAPLCGEVFAASAKRSALKNFALPRQRVLTEKDKADISFLISDAQNKNRWEAAFQIYVERRLSFVPIEHRLAVRTRIEKLTMIWDNLPTGDLIANHHQIYMSAKFKDTVAPWFIKAHEIEHIIQIYSRAQKQTALGEALVIGRNFYDPVFMYRLESDAMRAEWDILSITPLNEIQRLNEVVRETNLDPTWRGFLRFTVENRDLDREAYVKANHDEGRYSVGQVARVSAISWGKIGIHCGLIYLAQYLFF